MNLCLARGVAALMLPGRTLAGPAAVLSDQTEPILVACRTNKVPLLSLHLPSADWPALECARQKEWDSWHAQRAEYLPVHEALEACGVDSVLIKSVGLAPSLPYRSDNLDLLVSKANVPTARRCLLDLGYVELYNVEEPHKYLFRKFRGGVSVSAIHLHGFVGWGTEFLSDNLVLTHSRTSPDDPHVTIPSREDALLITLAHAFYEDKAVSLGDVFKFVHICRSGPDGLDWDAVCQRAERRGWLDGLDACLLLWSMLETSVWSRSSVPTSVLTGARARHAARGCVANALDRAMATEVRYPFALPFLVSKRLYWNKVWNDGQISFPQKAGDIARHIWAGIERRLPVRKQRAMLIALSGVDGSGKTTQAEHLVSAFAQCDLDARIVWSRVGSSRFTDAFVRAVRRWLPKDEDIDLDSASRSARVSRKGAWLRRSLLRRGWTTLVLVDLVLRYWFMILGPMLARRIVIADRYLFDALVELAALSDTATILESSWANAVARLCPRPSIAFLLDVAPSSALTRDPTEDRAFLDQQAFLYRNWALEWAVRAVDAERSVEDVSVDLARDALTSYYRRLPRSRGKGQESAQSPDILQR